MSKFTTHISHFPSVLFAFSLLSDRLLVSRGVWKHHVWHCLAYTSIASSSEANWELYLPSQPTLHRETEIYIHHFNRADQIIHAYLKCYRIINELTKSITITNDYNFCFVSQHSSHYNRFFKWHDRVVAEISHKAPFHTFI